MKSVNEWEKIELLENSKNLITICFKGGISILADEVYTRTDEKNNIYYKIINGWYFSQMSVGSILKRKKGEENFEVRYKTTPIISPLVLTYELEVMGEQESKYVLGSKEEAIKNLIKRHQEWLKDHPKSPNIFKRIYNKIFGEKKETPVENIAINVMKDFSKTPGPRYKTEGEYSGELFRELIVSKAKQAIKENKKLLIDLDGGYGYGVGFLCESFCETNKCLEISREEFLDLLVLKSDEEPSLIHEIELIILEKKND